MDLFKKKKFPKYIKDASSVPVLPKYESQFEDQEFKRSSKHEMADNYEMEKQDFGVEKPDFRTLSDTGYKEDLGILPRAPAKFELRTPDLNEASVFTSPIVPTNVPQYEGRLSQEISARVIAPMTEEPIYVKLEDYKRAVKNISLIKDKLNEAESVLSEITNLKKAEDDQISVWQKEIAEIKSKLLEVYKGLFEVNR